MKIEQLEQAIISSRERLMATQIFKRAVTGTLSLELYKGYLKETYHYVKHASRFYAAAACRLPEQYESVRAKLMQYAVEENGHETYLLNDLETLGVDPKAVKNSQPLIETESLVGYHYYTASFCNPLSIWGNIYAIEGLSVVALVENEIVKKLKKSLNLTEKSLGFLISHGEPNIAHMEGAKEIIENVIHTDSDRQAVTFCARAALELHAFMFNGIYENYDVVKSPQ